ncbi:hypothetical protein [Arenibaculum pallidiluteum]|uniref:hypothetical protein n=1 Tax=Arenibaculum pallidiluteum TaxID=2812559 RepID=UPI001A965653|nr:hypothetical protein [Arenibaculum pallidiluteum]
MSDHHNVHSAAGSRPAMSSVAGFDFLIGDWKVRHRRLKHRLAGCTDWAEFDGTTSARKILGGMGNMDENQIGLPDGAYSALSVRLFDARADRWSIWWIDARRPDALDPPVIGGFADGRGVFYGDDRLEGRPIRVRFIWSDITDTTARWEQAFSPDGGANWETNWVMEFIRA